MSWLKNFLILNEPLFLLHCYGTSRIPQIVYKVVIEMAHRPPQRGKTVPDKRFWTASDKMDMN